MTTAFRVAGFIGLLALLCSCRTPVGFLPAGLLTIDGLGITILELEYHTHRHTHTEVRDEDMRGPAPDSNPFLGDSE